MLVSGVTKESAGTGAGAGTLADTSVAAVVSTIVIEELRSVVVSDLGREDARTLDDCCPAKVGALRWLIKVLNGTTTWLKTQRAGVCSNLDVVGLGAVAELVFHVVTGVCVFNVSAANKTACGRAGRAGVATGISVDVDVDADAGTDASADMDVFELGVMIATQVSRDVAVGAVLSWSRIVVGFGVSEVARDVETALMGVMTMLGPAVVNSATPLWVSQFMAGVSSVL